MKRPLPLPPRSLLKRTRKQRHRKLRWERRYQRWKEELRDYRQHVIKTILTILITTMIAHFLGIDMAKAAQQVSDSFKELLNRLG